MLQTQNRLLNKVPLSDGLINWSKWLVSGTFEDDCADETPPPIGPMRKATSNGDSFCMALVMPENPATSLPTSAESINCSSRENNKEMTTLAYMQPTVEGVSDEDDNSIPQADPNQPADQDTYQSRENTGIKDDGYYPALPSGCPSPVVPVKRNHTPAELARSRSKGPSIRNKKGKHGQSATQVNPTLDKRLLKPKSSGINNTNPEIIISHWKADYPHWVKIYTGYTLMWSLFGPGSNKALRKDDFRNIFKLVVNICQSKLASFLEIQSNLWQTNRFWNPDPLCLPIIENLLTDKSCQSIFCYLWHLREETRINVVRCRFRQVRLYLSFN
jgi:hypothetical protein